VFAPALSRKPSAFAMRCPLDGCTAVRAHEFKDGAIGPTINRWRESYLEQLRLQRGVLELVADLVSGAIELHLWGQTNLDTSAKDPAYRGAAIHLRVALEAILGGYVLDLPEPVRRRTKLNVMIRRIEGGRYARSKIRAGHRETLVTAVKFLRDLGDTAGHPLLTKPEREIPATRGKVAEGLESFQKVVESLRISGVTS